MNCQTRISHLCFFLSSKNNDSCGFNACDGGEGDILPQWRMLQQDGLYFQNEQLISFSASQSFDCAYSTAKPLPLGYPKKKGLVWLLVIEKCVTLQGA
jgi:hypothetical protein